MSIRERVKRNNVDSVQAAESRSSSQRSDEGQTHELKTWPKYFEAIIARKKTFEIRVNDRDFQVGDMLVLQEYEPHTGYFSGREIKRQVTYIAQGVFGLPDDICVMALKAVEATRNTSPSTALEDVELDTEIDESDGDLLTHVQYRN